ncbi:aminoglycoside phosphotransferase family protein [Nocardioides hwasunensis]|uniref:Aminoglycoside phosphotransferase family protein n=1 Tax=Nocardioides hwasunensis TaxID=397258 RepID=A0ABR8MBW4_9ACTN|nr:aminoglycoside phosphotransferase family protein [Nocardioides hwasunensis]MBD3913618.1 aminoglycoside phosphotransferase family protein [Nocardioides hwasunensis]
MTGMHADEIAIDDETVRRLLAAQLPAWADLPLRRLPPVGTDNQLFRLGDDLLVRMPRIHWAADAAVSEHAWLPRIAPHLSLVIPAPVALGEPGEGYPWHWSVVPWIEGETPTEATFDPESWAVQLAAFVRECREVPGMDAPPRTEGRGGLLASLDDWVREWTARADPAEVSRDAVLEVWADALAAPAYDGEPCWFHGDLHEGNLLVRDGRLAAVIDWRTAGRGDPAIELNAMWGYLPASVARLYRDEVGLDEAAYRRARGFALAPAISGWTYYRETAPAISQGALATVRRLIASL